MEQSRIAHSIGIALDRFIKNNQEQFQYASGELSQLLRDIALASKVVNREISKAGLIDIMGALGSQNSAGDEQQKLDVLANIRFTRALTKGGEVCALISEETESFVDLNNEGKYVIAIDPLDGSSNIDTNVSIGTIFSIYFTKNPMCIIGFYFLQNLPPIETSQEDADDGFYENDSENDVDAVSIYQGSSAGFTAKIK